MTDTWGIPGTTFLWAFIAVAAVATVYAFVHRAAVVRGAGSGGGSDPLPPAHVAYLVGRQQRAVYASLTLLRKANAISVDEQSGRFERTGPLPAGAGNLDAAVLLAAGERLRDWQIRSHPAVLRALDEIGEDLRRRGLLLSDERRRAARRGGCVLLALLGLGVARLFSGLGNAKPVGYLTMVLLALGVLTLITLRQPAGLTAAGRKVVTELLRQYHYLGRSHLPAWQTYDPMVTALGVGLFGTTVLLAADPVLAAQTNVRPAAPSYGGGYGGGSSCGGASCGGGGGGGGGGCGG